MLFADMPPVVTQSCDPAAHAAAIDRLEDQAFGAMKAATERVAEASRRGAVGSAGDAEWASYKDLRAQAERLRAQPGGCPSKIAVAPAAPPAGPPVVEPRVAELAEAQAPLTAAGAAEPRTKRFRVELSANSADRQPSSASRLGVRTFKGRVYQHNLSRTPVPLPPPATPPTFPFPSGLYESVQLPSSDREGPRPSVKSWSSGATLSMEFAPAGFGEGWRWNASLEGLTEETRSHTAATSNTYRFTPGTPQYSCTLGSPAPVFYLCGYEVSAPATLDQYVLPNPQSGTLMYAADLHKDDVSQTSKRVTGRFGVARDFALASPVGGLTASLGGEAGFGWWTLEERESLIASAIWDFHRSADGPTALIGLTGEIGGPVGRGGNFRWSVRSALDYEVSDLTATSHTDYYYSFGQAHTESTVQNLDDQFTGRIGARLDYSRGPVGAFVSLDRRRDLSLVSTISASGAGGRASKRFLDGSSVAVWPVYNSRLTVGMNYGF